MTFGKLQTAKTLKIATALLSTVGFAIDKDSTEDGFAKFLGDRDAALKGGSAIADLFAKNDITLEAGETPESAFADMVKSAANTAENTTEIAKLTAEVARLTPFEAQSTARKGQIDGLAKAGIKISEGDDSATVEKSAKARISQFAREQLSSHGITTDDAPEGKTTPDQLAKSDPKIDGLEGRDKSRAVIAAQIAPLGV